MHIFMINFVYIRMDTCIISAKDLLKHRQNIIRLAGS